MTPGGIIPLWGARSSRNQGAASFRYEGRHHPGIGGRLPQESAASGISWAPTKGPEADYVSELAHMRFDKLSGIDPARRRREDRLPDRLLTTIETWLDDSDADDVVAWSHAYLAHAGGPEARQKMGDLNVPVTKSANR